MYVHNLLHLLNETWAHTWTRTQHTHAPFSVISALESSVIAAFSRIVALPFCPTHSYFCASRSCLTTVSLFSSSAVSTHSFCLSLTSNAYPDSLNFTVKWIWFNSAFTSTCTRSLSNFFSEKSINVSLYHHYQLVISSLEALDAIYHAACTIFCFADLVGPALFCLLYYLIHLSHWASSPSSSSFDFPWTTILSKLSCCQRTMCVKNYRIRW